ncbi:hypothetical protein QTJ16_001951 [Diplocarpon rosae]|uniref:J domain-containing protein n=1 Tax=Diplocarpon rosae TaxID=946125 RepID=A0AAD9WG32_9HELO|nr:hypothetical protein QTJ16_001951 [Diplocarpon rosae]PBP19219.1 hypothetical protein BUE80_DR009994 [Diplocarpon rosae]
MMRKSSVIFSQLNLHSLPAFGPASKTSLLHATCSAPPQTQQCRSYAIVSEGQSSHHHGQLRWPEMTSVDRIPTPYQIFDLKKGSPYSKRRYYELVKLYHPDRHDHDATTNGLSYATKLERYRLVVAANDLLSDPVKRGAYDCYGAGWNGAPDVAGPRDPSDLTATWGAYSGRGWGSDPKGPSNNATWEDWERWYERDAKGAQEPQYVSNAVFVGLILTFAIIGGIGQVNRASSYGMSFVEQRDNLHKSISKDLMRTRKETTTAYGSREERIDSFLRQRDPTGYGVTDPKWESYKKALPPPEICSSEGIKQRSTDVYHKRNIPGRKDE